MRSHGPNACIMTHPVYIASFSLGVWINRSLVPTHFSTCTPTHACIYGYHALECGYQRSSNIRPQDLSPSPSWSHAHWHLPHFLPFLIYGQLHLASSIQCFDTANDILALLTPGWAEVLAFYLKNTETEWVLRKANVCEKRNHHEI